MPSALLKLPACLALLALTVSARAEWTALKAANGTPILHPLAKDEVEVKDGARTLKIPAGMVYIPAGSFTAGSGNETRKATLPAYDWHSTGRSGVSIATGEGRSAHGGYHSAGFRIAMNLPAGK